MAAASGTWAHLVQQLTPKYPQWGAWEEVTLVDGQQLACRVARNIDDLAPPKEREHVVTRIDTLAGLSGHPIVGWGDVLTRVCVVTAEGTTLSLVISWFDGSVTL